MNIRNGFVNTVDDEWVNLNMIHSFYVNQMISEGKQYFQITARTISGVIEITGFHESEKDVYEMLDECMGL